MDLCSYFLWSYLLVPKLIFVYSFVSKARFVVPVPLLAILQQSRYGGLHVSQKAAIGNKDSFDIWGPLCVQVTVLED